jgi:hypothetical protein
LYPVLFLDIQTVQSSENQEYTHNKPARAILKLRTTKYSRECHNKVTIVKQSKEKITQLFLLPSNKLLNRIAGRTKAVGATPRA